MKRLQDVPKRDASHYDDIWKREFDDRPWKYDVTRHTEMASHVKEGDIVVDLAGGIYGTVQFIIEVLKLPIHGHIFDISSYAKEFVEAQQGIHFDIGVLPNTDYPDRFFDVVIATQILENMEDPAELVKEMFRICSSKGWISLSTIDMNEPNPREHGPWPNQIWSFDHEDLISLVKPYATFLDYLKLGQYHFIHAIKA